MDRTLQLYIGAERIDLFRDETISITQTIQNVRDIAKIFTSFTKTFSVPASKTNNKIFKHYYNYDIVNGFDARLKVNSTLEINNLPFKKGKIKLEGVNLKDRKPHTYRITFFGNTVELKDLLGDDKLNDLAFQGLNLDYGSVAVKNKLTNSFSTSTDIIAPLITHTQRLYYDSSDTDANTGNLYHSYTTNLDWGVKWNQLKYAIRVNRIIEEIEDFYTTANGFPINLEFSNDFFKNTSKLEMHNLFLWLHRKSGHVENLGGTNAISTTMSFATYQNSDYNVSSNGTFVIFGDCPQFIGDFELQISVNSNSSTIPYDVRIQRGLNQSFYVSTNNTGSQTIDMTSLVTNDCDLFGNFNGIYTVIITTTQAMTFNYVRWYIDFQNQGDPNLTTAISTGSFTTSTIFQFNISQQIPEIKTIEFLTGLFKMFNLTAFQDVAASDETTSVIKIVPLQEYYEDGKGTAAGTQPWDISEYIDSTQSKVDAALPYRQIVFKYKDTKTFLANRFEQLANTGWGEIDYTTGEAELAGRLYKVEAPFSHMQFERLNDANTGNQKLIQWGYSVNESQNAYKGAPLLFYPVRKNTYGIAFVDTINADGTAGNMVNISNVILPSNSVEMPSGSTPTDTSNINFNNEINEWTLNTAFTGTLFEEFYRDYIVDLFDPKKRLTRVTAYLPLNIMIDIQLNDVVVINQRKYRINSLTTDLLTGKSDFELLNIV